MIEQATQAQNTIFFKRGFHKLAKLFPRPVKWLLTHSFEYNCVRRLCSHFFCLVMKNENMEYSGIRIILIFTVFLEIVRNLTETINLVSQNYLLTLTMQVCALSCLFACFPNLRVLGCPKPKLELANSKISPNSLLFIFIVFSNDCSS